MIPKTIHYCWFGNKPLPEIVQKCIASWKKYCPDFAIIEWNESNYNINKNDYIKEAYNSEKWAFVSDYARLDIVYNYGGFYLDTDVELLKSLTDFLNYDCVLAQETTGHINTGLCFGATQYNVNVKYMLDEYNGIHFKLSDGIYDLLPCPTRNTKPLLSLGYNPRLNKNQIINGAHIYCSEYFCPIDYNTKKSNITSNTYAIHHFNSSWITEKEKKIMEARKEAKSLIDKIKVVKLEYTLNVNNKKIGNLLKYIFNRIKKKIINKKNKL